MIIGMIVQIVTENSLVVIGVSMVLGLVFFRSSKPKSIPVKQTKNPASKPLEIQKSKPSTIRGQIFCMKCGEQQPLGHTFCNRCGARLGQSPQLRSNYQPADIVIRYNKFKLDNYHGLLPDDRYRKLFENRFQDERGGIWSIGAQTLDWYRAEKGRWIRDDPKTKLRVFKNLPN